MVATVIGGFIFLGSQVWEWSTFIAGIDGVIAKISSNPYGPPQYAQFFYCVTGFHGFHVFSGVVINIVILVNAIGGTYERRGHYEMVEKVGLYWHFVDLVWVFVFTFYYLL
jgi:cytochrome c oxidase subunit 3